MTTDPVLTPIRPPEGQALASAHRLIHQWRSRTHEKAERLDKALRSAARMRVALRALARDSAGDWVRHTAADALRAERAIREPNADRAHMSQTAP